MSKTTLTVGYTVAKTYTQNSTTRVSIVLYVDLKSSTIDLEIGQFDDSVIAINKRTSLNDVLVSLVNAKLIGVKEYNAYQQKLEEYKALPKEDKELVDSPTNSIFAELADIIGDFTDSRHPFTLTMEDDSYEVQENMYLKKDGKTTFKLLEIVPSVGNLIGKITSKGIVPIK